MDYKSATQAYRKLTAQYKREAMTHEQYLAKVNAIRFKDQDGRTWMIEAGSGKYFVFQDGKWVAADPGNRGIGQQASAATTREGSTAAQTPESQGSKRSRMNPLFIALAFMSAAAILCVATVVVISGVYLLQGRDGKLSRIQSFLGSSTPEEIQSPPGSQTPDELPLTLTAIATHAVGMGQAQVVDDNQTEVMIPMNSLPEGINAKIIVSEPNTALAQELESLFLTVGHFYQVAAEGENDGTGRAQISIPVSGSGTFLLEVFDNIYTSLTPVNSVNGRINLSIPLGSGLVEEANDSLVFKGSYAFALVSQPAASQMPDDIVGISSRPAVDPRSCGIKEVLEQTGYMTKPKYKVTSVCRKNTAGTVQILAYPPETPNISNTQLDQAVDLMEQVMGTYANEGFTAARPAKPEIMVTAIVKKGGGDPTYSPKNRTVYLPEDSLGNANLKYELAHELAHWVQDENYNMTGAYWENKLKKNSPRTWWLEVSAESMVMIYAPEYIEANLAGYGPTNPYDRKSPFQFAPNQWNDQLYLHAQLLKVFTCENTNVCPISISQFIKAINKGTYPIDSAAVDKMSSNLGEYVHYLLGKPPQQANSTIFIMNRVTSGKGYGDFVAPVTKGAISSYQRTGYAPQMKLVSGEYEKELLIEVVIEKGGVYPLMVGAPVNLAQIGLPAMIEIEAGTPFYYRIDGGKVEFHDGKAKISLGPVHTPLGLGTVRIVAVAGDGAKTFKAKIKPLDLSGDWMIFYDSMISNGVVCHDPDDINQMTPEELAMFGSYLTSYPAAMAGMYIRDETGNSYTWTPYPGADLSFDGEIPFQIRGAALIAADGITVEQFLSIPNMDNSSSTEPDRHPVVLASSLALGAVSLVVFRRKKLRLPMMVLLVVLVISGCGAYFGFYTENTVRAEIKQLIPAEGKEMAALLGEKETGPGMNQIPLYMAKGIATTNVDFTMVGGGASIDKKNEAKANCSGTMTYNVIGFFFEDGVITELPDFGE